jgi:hypothetical protein
LVVVPSSLHPSAAQSCSSASLVASDLLVNIYFSFRTWWCPCFACIVHIKLGNATTAPVLILMCSFTIWSPASVLCRVWFYVEFINLCFVLWYIN